MVKDILLFGIIDFSYEWYKEVVEVCGLIEIDLDVCIIYQIVCGLEGLICNVGVYVCVVIMSSELLIEVILLWKWLQDGVIIIGWDYLVCEVIGLLKMDFLGLWNLMIIGDVIDNVRVNRGIDFDLEFVLLDDKVIYELLGCGDILGVFQFDGGFMCDLLCCMQLIGFEDVVVVIVLYWFGLMGMNVYNDYVDCKNNWQVIKFIYLEFEELLCEIFVEIYGFIVY